MKVSCSETSRRQPSFSALNHLLAPDFEGAKRALHHAGSQTLDRLAMPHATVCGVWSHAYSHIIIQDCNPPIAPSGGTCVLPRHPHPPPPALHPLSPRPLACLEAPRDSFFSNIGDAMKKRLNWFKYCPLSLAPPLAFAFATLSNSPDSPHAIFSLSLQTHPSAAAVPRF